MDVCTRAGYENMIQNRLIYNVADGECINDYDPTVNPTIINEHATVAFRYFHTQIAGYLQ